MLRLVIGLNKRPYIEQAILQGCLFFDLDTAPSVESCLALLTTICRLDANHNIVLTTEKSFVVKKLRLLVLQNAVPVVTVFDTDTNCEIDFLYNYTNINFCSVDVQIYKEEFDLL